MARASRTLAIGFLVMAAPGLLSSCDARVGRSAAAAGAEEGDVVVTMTDEMTFAPEHLVIESGDTVLWVNEGGMPHTSTNKPGTAAVPEHNVLPAGAEPWDSGLVQPGDRYAHTFTVPGEYTYLCYLHEAMGMVARITVR